MINLTNEGPVEKEIQLKKRTILKVINRFDFNQIRKPGINFPIPTDFPTSNLPPTVGTFK